jgi:hypothetical protein
MKVFGINSIDFHSNGTVMVTSSDINTMDGDEDEIRMRLTLP